MDDIRIRRLMGICGIAAGVFAAVGVPLYFVYSGAPPASNVLARILLNILTCGALLVFLTGLRHLIRSAGADFEWLASLVFGSGLAYVTVTLVATSIEAGTVLEHPGGSMDPTVDGTLAHANMLLHGSVARLLTAILLIAAGYAILRSGVLPRWNGRLAYIVAAVNLAFIPSLFFGTDAADFYSAVGWGNTAMTAALVVYWALAVGVTALRRPARAHARFA
jgi:type IV secretory pathway VirB2 component (pilin)